MFILEKQNDEIPDKRSSFKDFLSKPLITKDSRAIQYSGLGIQLTVTILVFLYIGIWLDGISGTKFLFTLILTLMGFGGGFYSFYLSIRKLTQKPGDKASAKDDTKGKAGNDKNSKISG